MSDDSHYEIYSDVGDEQNEEDNTKQVDKKYIVDAIINGAQHLKNTIVVVKAMNPSYEMRFSKEGITSDTPIVTQNNEHPQMIFKTFITGESIFSYKFGLEDDEEVVVDVESDQIESVLKSCRKNINFRMTIYSGECTVRCQTLVGSNPHGSGITELDSKILEPVIFPSIDIPGGPIVRIIASEFSEAIKNAIKAKSNNIVFTIYEKGVSIDGLVENNNKTKTVFGDCEIPFKPNGAKSHIILQKTKSVNSSKFKFKREYHNVISIPIAKAKNLGNLGGVSHDSSIINLYYCSYEGIKITGPIGCFGSYEFYIKRNHTIS